MAPEKMSYSCALPLQADHFELDFMKDSSRYSFLGTVIYGLFIIVPIAILFLFLVQVTEILEKLAAPLGMESSLGAAIELIVIVAVALTVILLFGFIVGTIMRRIISYEKFESVLLNEIPGYQIVANIARGFTGGETSYTPALIEIDGPGAAVLGFIMEEHDDSGVLGWVRSSQHLRLPRTHSHYGGFLCTLRPPGSVCQPTMTCVPAMA